ncbi:hypothetical protein [Nocardiopsis sp. SBT366]|uniref:hypothetical protein n=1 Tax=Nocardiopsis sp. SBT366 TaxID=1580529 RepID=UPI00069F7B4D|nr:hypothetical protein [Nocardiopsis sp. SBT366]
MSPAPIHTRPVEEPSHDRAVGSLLGAVAAAALVGTPTHLAQSFATAHLTLTNHPSLARTADRIHLLHHGHTTETGTHHQLLLRGGAYARLYALQSTPT